MITPLDCADQISRGEHIDRATGLRFDVYFSGRYWYAKAALDPRKGHKFIGSGRTKDEAVSDAIKRIREEG